MKTIIHIFLLVSIFSFSVTAAEYAIIANKNMKHLSAQQIRAIYLKKLTIINDVRIVPVNLGSRDLVRKTFNRKVLKMSLSRLKKYWTKQHYLGHRPPISMKSEQSIKKFIKRVDGSIGYIKINNIDDDVQILYKWSD